MICEQCRDDISTRNLDHLIDIAPEASAVRTVPDSSKGDAALQAGSPRAGTGHVSPVILRAVAPVGVKTVVQPVDGLWFELHRRASRPAASSARRGRGFRPGIELEPGTLREEAQRVVEDDLANQGVVMASPPHLEDQLRDRQRVAVPPVAGRVDHDPVAVRTSRSCRRPGRGCTW